MDDIGQMKIFHPPRFPFSIVPLGASIWNNNGSSTLLAVAKRIAKGLRLGLKTRSFRSVPFSPCRRRQHPCLARGCLSPLAWDMFCCWIICPCRPPSKAGKTSQSLQVNTMNSGASCVQGIAVALAVAAQLVVALGGDAIQVLLNLVFLSFVFPRFPWNEGISLAKPPFGARSCEVAIYFDQMTWESPQDPSFITFLHASACITKLTEVSRTPLWTWQWAVVAGWVNGLFWFWWWVEGSIYTPENQHGT